MSAKVKLISLIISFITLISLVLVGVWAVMEVDFSLGGDITFTAKGVTATISEGVLSDSGSFVTESDADIKMKEIVTTSKTDAQLQNELKSWQELNLLFNENGDDITITFSITNTTNKIDEVIAVNVGVDGGIMTNATAEVSSASAYLAMGESQEFVITFAPINRSEPASLRGYQINFNMIKTTSAPVDTSTLTNLSFKYNETTKQASVKAANTSIQGDIVIPSYVTKDNTVYAVTSLDAGAFYGCTAVTSVVVPDKVASLGGSDFYDCTSLTSITMSENIKYIYDCTFYNCTNLSAITIPNEVTGIGNYAFYGCISLANVNFSNRIKNIGSYCFCNCTTLTRVELPDNIVTLGDYIFSGCTALVDVELSENLITIPDRAFNGCNLLANITLPEKLALIGNYAFTNCSSISSINFPTNLTKIGNYGFTNCTALSNINIPDNVINIGNYVFSGCKGLTNAYIGNAVESIGEYAFNNCSTLQNITLGKSIKNIGADAFKSCTLLSDMNYLGDVNSWASIVFGRLGYNHSANPIYFTKFLKINGEIVTNAVIDTATRIEMYSFVKCESLVSIHIGENVTFLGGYAFQNCTNIKEITVHGNNKTFDSRNNSNAIIRTETNNLVVGCQNTIIPNTVTSIGNAAFYDCDSLTKIDIPEGVIEIEASAFYDCSSLSEISLPKSITNIGTLAFDSCDTLKNVYYAGSEEDWANITIGNKNYELINATRTYNYTGD